MSFNRVKSLATMVSLLCFACLALYGGYVLLGGARPAWAQSAASDGLMPRYVSYQGTLRDADGDPLAGSHTIAVKLYGDAAGASQLWSQPAEVVEVREGHFSLLVGPIPDDLFGSSERYAGLVVDGEEIVPAQRFVAVPYAFYADRATALSAPDGDPLDAVTVSSDGKVAIGAAPQSGALTVQGIGDYSAWLSLIDNLGTPQWHLNYAGTGLNFVETGVANNRLFLRDGGSVGIGTNNPASRLDVDGAITANGLDVSGNAGVGTAPGNSRLTVSGPDNDGAKAGLEISSGSQVMLLDGNEIISSGPLYLNNVQGSTGGHGVHIGGDLEITGDISWIGEHYSTRYAANSPAAAGITPDTQMLPTNEGFCALALVHFNSIGESDEDASCNVTVDGDYWWLHATSDPDHGPDSYAHCRAYCFKWSP